MSFFFSCRQFLVLGLVFVIPAAVARAQSTPTPDSPAKPTTLFSFDPTPSLVVPVTKLTKAKYPVIDVHSHFGIRLKGDREALQHYLTQMSANQIAISISLDAVLGSEEDHLDFINATESSAVVAFAHIDFKGTGGKDPASWACNQPGFVRNCVEQLRAAKTKGILGLKFFKSFGLTYKDKTGTLIKIDDQTFDPIWEACGQLGLPVIMHVADPIAFFKPIDANNERWEELSRHPDWSFHGAAFPDRQELLSARNRILKRHPETIFIGAHCANSSEDLKQLSGWLDKYPNLMIGFASRINELGRQPYTARKFFIQYQDRILFSTDGPWPDLRLSYYWRFLETYDEYFPYSEKSPPPQGMWRIYGIGLPDTVLKKIYFENALRILPALKPIYETSDH
jgi:predicted TIM-barrel fold metal-dependent hydrolase